MAIDWHPIADIPSDRKDGREMLLWYDTGDSRGANVGTWSEGAHWGDGDPPGFWEALYETLKIPGVTHWADIEPPEGGR